METWFNAALAVRDKGKSDPEHRLPGQGKQDDLRFRPDVEDLIVELLANHTIG